MSSYIDDLIVENTLDAPEATGLTKGLMSATDKTKIDTVASGATVNDTNAALRDRSTHTGTQLASTISDFSSAADARISAQKGVANGIANLDASGFIPTSLLPAIAITDTFIVASQVAMLALTAEKGDVAVRTDLSKSFILKTNSPSTLADWQELLTPTDTVLSVNGQTGIVSLTTTNISEGTNLYYTQGRFDSAFTAKSTTDLSEGTNLYYLDTRAIAAPLTGYASTVGTITDSDSILSAIEKLNGNLDASLPVEYHRITTATQSSTSTTYAAVTELTSVSLATGKYKFECFSLCQSTSTTAGLGLRVGAGTATLGVTHARWFISQGGTGTAQTYQYGQTSATTNSTSASANNANSDFTATGLGYFNVTAAGTVAIQIRTSNGGTGVSIRAGSIFSLKKIG